MREVIYKIILDCIINENISNQMEECDIKDILQESDSNAEIGIKFYTRLFNLLNFKVIAQLWGLNQNLQFNSLKLMYYRGAKLIIYIKSNNSSTVSQLIDDCGKAGINLNQVILLENTEAFTETFFRLTMILALYYDDLISDVVFRNHLLSYEKGNNPKILLASKLSKPEI
ncbi:MAG: hypothetical protein ACFFEN_04235 [Candidatus Thorarchaeota archaeon]